MKSLISIVIPCYNESEVINTTFLQIENATREFNDFFDIEFIFIDDGSSDETRRLLKNKATKDKRYKLVGFSRNFGHQIAVSAGIDLALGDAIVIIDADLQDPPHIISEMIKLWSQGYDVVYGTRVNRPGESKFKLATARIFYRILNKLSDIPIPIDTGDFRLINRRVVNALKTMPERDRFIRGMVSWVGFRQVSLPYIREARFAGVSKYPLRKMVAFALDGIISFSTKPLQLFVGLGLMSACLALFGIIYVFLIRIYTNVWVEGWTALMITILFIGGIQLLGIGMLGEYIGRIYNEAKGRPLYVIDERVGFDESNQ